MITNKNMIFGDSLVVKNKRDFLINTLQNLYTLNLTGCIAEVGVYKGGTAKDIFNSIQQNDKLFLFDTFEGIPNQSEFDNIHIIGDFCDSPYDDIVEYFKKYDNVIIYKGIFPKETSYYVDDEIFKFVHLDVDTYLSYKDSLDFFYDKMIIGGYIIFDDYNVESCFGATKAINDFFNNKKECIECINNNYFIIKQ